MSIYKREYGAEQPYWPLGPFQVRLPVVHYKLETAEIVQGIIMVVISIAIIPHLEEHAGIPYEIALAINFIAYGFGNLLPVLLGTPYVSGWITPALPLVATYLGDFEPGMESIQALIALNIIVFAIFFILGITKTGSKILRYVPNSMQAGIILGAGIAALMGEIGEGGTVLEAPIAMIAAALLTVYFMFSQSFEQMTKRFKFAKITSNYGIVPALTAAIAVAFVTQEFPRPNVQWGITWPDFAGLWQYSPFVAGFPAAEIFIAAIPTAIISYIIAYGDIIVGTTLTSRADKVREDEKIDYNIDRLHLITAIRNLNMALFAPSPGQGGPIWTAVQATVSARYGHGRKAMDSFYGGAGSLHLACGLALFILPVISFFQPYQSLALSVTMLATAYVCIQVGLEQLKSIVEAGVAGVVAVVLALHGAVFALLVGAILYLLVEKPWFKDEEEAEEVAAQDPDEHDHSIFPDAEVDPMSIEDIEPDKK